MGATMLQADASVGIADDATYGVDPDGLVARRVAANEHVRVEGGGTMQLDDAIRSLRREGPR
jgi:hypothetical protein